MEDDDKVESYLHVIPGLTLMRCMATLMQGLGYGIASGLRVEGVKILKDAVRKKLASRMWT